MYGSSFQFEQSMNSMSSLKTSAPKSEGTIFVAIVAIVLIGFSTAGFANTSSPRLCHFEAHWK